MVVVGNLGLQESSKLQTGSPRLARGGIVQLHRVDVEIGLHTVHTIHQFREDLHHFRHDRVEMLGACGGLDHVVGMPRGCRFGIVGFTQTLLLVVGQILFGKGYEFPNLAHIGQGTEFVMSFLVPVFALWIAHT